MLFTVLLFLFLFATGINKGDSQIICGNRSQNTGYYWRNFYGNIPSDAFLGGKDIANGNIYVGLGIEGHDTGIIGTAIYPGQKVYVPYDGSRAAEYIQILCSRHPKCFKWIPANITNLHFVTANTHAVQGGWERGVDLNIGRVNLGRAIAIGKILASNKGEAYMKYLQNGIEKAAISYEVLTYDEGDIWEIDTRGDENFA